LVTVFGGSMYSSSNTSVEHQRSNECDVCERRERMIAPAFLLCANERMNEGAREREQGEKE
jgi:hypothetical protein